MPSSSRRSAIRRVCSPSDDAAVTAEFVDRYLEVSAGLRLHWRDYAGEADPTPVLCLPGLTRNCRDFERLAPHLSRFLGRRVIALDLRGRGLSDHDPEWRNYRLDVYVRDVLAVLDAVALPRVVVIGTSLGGFVGMFLASEHRERVTGLVLNDIGPELEMAGMLRIATSAGKARAATSWQEAADDARSANAQVFPDFTNADWLQFARRIYREQAFDCIVREVDPNVGRAVREASGPTPDFWAAFRALRDLPLLCLRGEFSDLLSARTVERMAEIHPGMQSCVIPRRGHAPTLDEPASCAAIDGFVRPL